MAQNSETGFAMFSLALIAVLAAVLLLLSPGVALAYTERRITVGKIPDNKPAVGCTLREALDLANAGAPMGPHPNGCTVSEVEGPSPTPVVYYIILPAYSYTLSGLSGEDSNARGDLDVRANVYLVGKGPGATIIKGGGNDRVFDIDPQDTGVYRVRFSGLTFQQGGGVSKGGGIRNQGDDVVEVDDAVFYDNQASQYGGGIHNRGAFTLTHSTVLSNTAGFFGGGIYHAYSGEQARMVVEDCIFRQNVASGGGGVLAESALTLVDSTIHDNHATSYGGGIGNSGGKTLITGCEVYSNTAPSGGGLSVGDMGGRVTIEYSAIYSNTATTDKGGGIENWELVTITHSTISDNRAASDGGGIFTSRGLQVLNSTFSGNEAEGHGGGLSCRGEASLQYATITGNRADADGNSVGNGGGIYRDSGTIALTSTIVAGNADGTPKPGTGHPDCSGAFVSGDYNLIGMSTGCFLGGLVDHNLVNEAADLGPLANNGGGTLTHALLPGSAAVDQIPTGENGCGLDPFDVDQRDVSRPQGAACEIGAYELGPDLSIVKEAEPLTDVLNGGVVTYTIVLSNAGLGAEDVNLADTLPVKVSFARWLAPPPAGSDIGGQELTWSGDVGSGAQLIFRFAVTHTGGPGDIVTNTATYSHASGTGGDSATFVVEGGHGDGFLVYLPIVLKDAEP